MDYHKNSTPFKGIFEELRNVGGEFNFEFYIDYTDQKLLLQSLSGSMMTSLLYLVDEDPEGDVVICGVRCSASEKPLDMAVYYHGVIELFDENLTSEIHMSNTERQFIKLVAKLAMFYNFKLYFKDDPYGLAVCFDNRVEPIIENFDFDQLITATLERFKSFIW